MREMERGRLLAQWQHSVISAAHSGKLTGKPCQISKVYPISGPRAGALELLCTNLESGALLRALSKDDCANLRQLTPWDFAGNPQTFLHSRYVRIEAGWPRDLAETIVRLSDLDKHPYGKGQWRAGKSERGNTIVPGLNDQTNSWLFSGATGSGKSIALQAAVIQLSADPSNEIVLIDGKMGESLEAVSKLPCIVGPVATEISQVRAALGWAAIQMKERYEQGFHDGRVIVAFDEFQEFATDVVVAELLRKLAAQGRGASVSLLLATQHPVVKMFGRGCESTRRNLSGRLSFRVADAAASQVALAAATPRADHLLSAGDCYAVKPGAVHRMQGVFVDEQEITAAENGGFNWRFQRWPDYSGGESLGQELPVSQFIYTGDELGVALVSAAKNEGRTRFAARMNDAGFGKPGYNRQKRLRNLGQGALDWMQANRYTVCEQPTASVQDIVPVPVIPDVW